MVTVAADPGLDCRMQNLAKANRTRIDRAVLRRRIACGEVSVIEVLADIPACALSWRMGELMRAQHRWGMSRTRRFLAVAQVGEMRKLGALTDRQRRVLARMLEARNG